MALEHVFDAELQYQPGMAPLADDGEGILVGSGDGTVAGPVLAGALRWTLFEHPGELVCAMSPTLRIDTRHGAEIAVDGRGFAARERAGSSEWRAAATLRFRTNDTRYAWLDGALGFWEGEFDAERHRARYRAYLARNRRGGPMNTGTPTDALNATGIPGERRGREWLRGLSSGERALYRWILNRFGAGAPPVPADLTDSAVDAGRAGFGDLLEED